MKTQTVEIGKSIHIKVKAIHHWPTLKTVLMVEKTIRDAIRERLISILEKHNNKNILLIAHSMGSIIALDVLNNFDVKVDTLVTIGSPLGLAVIRSKVVPPVEEDSASPIPHTIKRSWFNLADLKDKVALDFDLADDFYDDISFSTACTSSANAIGYAHEVLSKGVYKHALVVGVDSLSQTTVGGFLTLGVLSSQPCKPFDVSRDGMNVAEAIACVLLESEPSASAVEVCGVGYSSDAYHMTHPHPDGKGAVSAMSNALASSSLKSEQIDYINAHGTGTIANDNAEANAIATLFSHKPYVSSTKSITGHTLGAAGALEAIIACMTIETQTIPKNTFLDVPENNELNLPVTSLKSKIDYVLSNSFAFGGNNCSLVFGKVK